MGATCPRYRQHIKVGKDADEEEDGDSFVEQKYFGSNRVLILIRTNI